MTDKELMRLLRLGAWGGAGDEEMKEAADRIEQLNAGIEAVAVLQCWLEDNLPDQTWEAIPVNIWNNVTALTALKGKAI